MSALDDDLALNLNDTPSELTRYLIGFFLELLFPKQSTNSWHCILELKRINDAIDERAAQRMVDDGFKLIPPRVEFVLPPHNDFTEQWMDEFATFWNDVQRNG